VAEERGAVREPEARARSTVGNRYSRTGVKIQQIQEI
jgi:hypothetical protein